MPGIAFDPLPYGVRDLRVYPLTGETPGTGVDFPRARQLSFSEAESFDDLRGDDGLVAVHGKGPQVNWQIEQGGLTFAAFQVINGGTIATTGVTPNQVTTYTKKGTDIRPYFKMEGQVISDSGGDFHIVLYRNRATGDMKGDAKEGAFWLLGASGISLPRASDSMLYQLVQNETAAAITG
jgi:hypothetical protein